MKNISILVIALFMLTSCLPSIFTAATSAGVTVAQERSVGDAIDDTTIWMGLKKAFFKEGFKDLFNKIDVNVIEGRVLLTGVVASEEDILKAVEISWLQKGVREVINELKVDSENSNKINPIQYAKDSWITGQIKTKLFANRNVKFINYTVETQRNVVYLFGIATSQEELELVAEAAAEVKGVEKVVSHVRVQNSRMRLKSLGTYKD